MARRLKTSAPAIADSLVLRASGAISLLVLEIVKEPAPPALENARRRPTVRRLSPVARPKIPAVLDSPHIDRAHFRLPCAFDQFRSAKTEPSTMKSSTKNQATGLAKSVAGKVKEVTGKTVGNPRLEAAGKAQKIEGKTQQKVGEIQKVLGS